MKRTWALIAAAGLLAAAATGWIAAQDKAAPPAGAAPARPADEQAIREAAQAFARAFEKGDAPAVGALWTEEGEYINEEGTPVRGRAALAKAYANFFAKRPELKVESKTDKVRFLGTDTAVEEGTFTVKAKDSPADTSRYSALWVRQGGRWLMALLKEWGDDAANRPSLQDLAWLIGAWESDGPILTARTTYEWAENKNFIRAHYTLTPKKPGEPASSGTQVIGVDPASSSIRAWTFDSDGGIGEASWTWDGERWVIDSAGTLPDGSETKAQNFLTRAGDDAFTWKSVKRTLAGEALPDLGPVKVKRVAAGR
jgi:uncharacterized protein (TIGR02246 family)